MEENAYLLTLQEVVNVLALKIPAALPKDSLVNVEAKQFFFSF